MHTHGVSSLGAYCLLKKPQEAAPVATMTVSASTSLESVKILKGRWDRSTFVTVSENILVPNRSLCALKPDDTRQVELQTMQNLARALQVLQQYSVAVLLT